jgi:hypothetical protein
MNTPAADIPDAWKDGLELALKHADICTKIVQFFVAASVAVGGWVVSSEDLSAAPPLDGARVVWAILYTMLATPLWLALLDLQRRINAIYAHLRALVPASMADAARPFDRRLVAFGFPLFVLMIDLFILLMHESLFR